MHKSKSRLLSSSEIFKLRPVPFSTGFISYAGESFHPF